MCQKFSGGTILTSGTDNTATCVFIPPLKGCRIEHCQSMNDEDTHTLFLFLFTFWVTSPNTRMTSILVFFVFFMLLLFSERSPWMCQISRCYCLLADARLQVPITRHPCGVISIKLWQKRSNLYHEKWHFSDKHSRKFFGLAGTESDKHHLLLMLLRTFGASLANTAPRHCITIDGWVLAA